MQGNTELTALTQLAAQKSNPLVTLLPVILIGVVFYFLLFRPQRKRQQAQAQLQRQVQPGQRVMTTAGMIAEVVAVEDDAVVLEIAPGVEVRFVKQAVGQVLHDDEDVEDDEPEETEEAADSTEPTEPTEPTEAAGSTRSTDSALAADTEHEAAPEARETLQDDVEAKTETLPGATGKKSEDTPLNEGEDKSGKRPSA